MIESIHHQSTQEEEKISVVETVRVLVKRRYFIVASTAIGALFIVLLSLYTAKLPNTSRFNVLPNVFTATASVRFVESPSTAFSQVAQQNNALGGLAGLIGGAALTGPSNADFAIALLKGDTLADQVASHMGFIRRFHITKRPMTTARSIFEHGLKSRYSLTDGILTVSYTNLDRKFATNVVNETIDVLQNRFNTLNLDEVNSDTDYLEGRLAAAGEDLRNSQDRLVSFMNKYGIVDLQAQSDEQSSQLSNLNQQIQAKEIQLATLRHYGRSDDDPAVTQLRTDIGILQNLVTEIRNGTEGFNINGISAQELPRVSAEYLSLKNNVAIQQSVYALVQEQYQTSKLQENAETKTLQVVERALVPEIGSSPNRRILCQAFTIAMMLLSIFVSFVREHFEKARLDPTQAPKLEEIDTMLKRGGRSVNKG